MLAYNVTEEKSGTRQSAQASSTTGTLSPISAAGPGAPFDSDCASRIRAERRASVRVREADAVRLLARARGLFPRVARVMSRCARQNGIRRLSRCDARAV